MTAAKISIVSSKGQFTIPSNFRQAYEIDEGTYLLVVPIDVGILLKPLDLSTLDDIQSKVAEQHRIELDLRELE